MCSRDAYNSMQLLVGGLYLRQYWVDMMSKLSAVRRRSVECIVPVDCDDLQTVRLCFCQ